MPLTARAEDEEQCHRIKACCPLLLGTRLGFAGRACGGACAEGELEAEGGLVLSMSETRLGTPEPPGTPGAQRPSRGEMAGAGVGTRILCPCLKADQWPVSAHLDPSEPPGAELCTGPGPTPVLGTAFASLSLPLSLAKRDGDSTYLVGFVRLCVKWQACGLVLMTEEFEFQGEMELPAEAHLD